MGYDLSQHSICLHGSAIGRRERIELRAYSALRGNARRLLHGVDLRDGPGCGPVHRQRDSVLANAVPQLVGAQVGSTVSAIILSNSSATGGPLPGSVGGQGWNHFSKTAVAPPGTASATVLLVLSSSSASGSVYCDDFEVGPAAAGPSRLSAGSISNSGTLTVGPTNTVAVGGTFVQTLTGALDIQLGGGPGAPGYPVPWVTLGRGNVGAVDASGAATLAGTLETDLVYGYSPSTTDSFTPIEFAGASGGFTSLALPSGSGYQFQDAVTSTGVVLYAAPLPLSTTTWIAGSGNWSQASNWSNGVPTATSAATISPASAATITIQPGEADTVENLTLGNNATLSMPAGGVASQPLTSQLVAATISNSGTLSVGPANTVNVGGALVQTLTGTLDIQLGGAGAPSTLGRGSIGLVNVSGAAALAGTLKADVVDSYAPATTDTFTPIEFASASGSFANLALPSGSGFQFQSAVTFTNVVLSAAPTTALTATVNASTTLHAATANLLGVNMIDGDSDAATAETQQMTTAAGIDIYRIPGGSGSDDYHFNVANTAGSGSLNFAQLIEAITAAGGTGMVTLDYGLGSPQEAAAELAYVDGSPTDATSLGNGIQWNDSTGAWQTVNWETVGYWAALRGSSPLATDDGLNFLRIAHPAPFSNIQYWEVGNEVYGSWEIDHHGTLTPTGASTGAQHDPATYAAFTAQFAALAAEIQTAAGLPPISIGIVGGDPTGESDNNWTENVLADGLKLGFVPGYISDHSYMQTPGQENDSVLLDDTVSQSGNVLNWSMRYADFESILQQALGSQASSVEIMATEYNSVYGTPGKQLTSLVNGLFVAESLGGLLDSGYTGGFVWELSCDSGWSAAYNDSNLLYGWREGGDYGQLGDPDNLNAAPATGPYVGYPGYYALQLASKIIQNGGEVVSATSNYSDLDVYAVKEASGDLALLVINVNPAASLTEQFDLTGFQPAGAAQVWQYGETQDAAQGLSATGASALAEASTSVNLSGSNFSYSFPAYSMTVLDLAPSANTATDSPGVYSNGYWYFNVNGTTKVVASPAGWSGATPVVGDWNGMGKDEVGLYLNGNWWLDTNGDGVLDSGDAQFTFGFSGSDVVPVVGDWNGAGKTEVGVYANGAWFRDYDNSHTWDAANQAQLAYLGWNDNGTHTVIPVPGNWAGDGKTEMGVYCQGVWFLDSTGSGQWDGNHTYWGWAGSLIPVVGNWTGSSAKSQFGVYNQGAWFLDYDNSHLWDAANQAALTFYGWTAALPLVGNWGSGFKAAPMQAASSLQTPVPAAGQSQPVANEVIGDGTAVGAGDLASALPPALLLATDAPGGDSGLEGGNAVQADAGAAGSGQVGDPTPANDGPLDSTPLTTQFPALDPQAADRIDLSMVVEDALLSDSH